MTDRAEPGVTPRSCDPREHGGQHAPWCATLDAATPRPGLVEALDSPAARKAVLDVLKRFDLAPPHAAQVLSALRAALASGTGEPGMDV